MRHPLTRQTGHFGLVTAISSILAVGACVDGPTAADFDIAEPALADAASQRQFPGGPPAYITITQQPTVAPNIYSPGRCIFPYAFDIDAKGKDREVRWITHWIGGEHDGDQYGSNTTTVGKDAGTASITLTPGHDDDGHSFTSLRIRVQDPESGKIFAEAFTEGRTMSCPAG